MENGLDSEGLERVFLRLLNCESDEGLQELLKKFLVPVILSLQTDTLLTKVQELLGHVNKRLLNRPALPLPFYLLVELVKRTNLSSFTMNMGVLYVKKGYERLELKERVANVDLVFSCLANATDFQTDVLLSVLLSTLPHLKIPNYTDKQEKMIPSLKNSDIAKKIFKFTLKIILLPYITVADKTSWNDQTSLTQKQINGILQHVPLLTPDQLEGAKCTLVNLASCDIFNYTPARVAGLLVLAAADTRCSVSDAAESRLKKLRNSVNWEDEGVIILLYGLFLGQDKLPAKFRGMSHEGKSGNLRIRMRILHTLALSKYAANFFPLNIQVVFGGLFAEDANRQLQVSAVQFVHKICDDGSDTVLKILGAMLKQALLKAVQAAKSAGHMKLCGSIYFGLGKLSTRCPELFSSDVPLLSILLSMLEQENKELVADLKQGLFLMTEAYRAVLGTREEALLEELLLTYINKNESSACCVALRFSNLLHPSSHLPSRYLCLLALGSSTNEVVEVARAGIAASDHQQLPDFGDAVQYIGTCTKERLGNPELCYAVGSQILPYLPKVFIEVLKYTRRCLDVKLPEETILENEIYKNLKKILLGYSDEVISQYKNLITSALVPASSGELQSFAMENLAQLSASLPASLGPITFPWLAPFLKGPSPSLRFHTATLMGLAARAGQVQGWGNDILKLLNNKRVSYEELDGAILAAGYLSACVSTEICKEIVSAVVLHLNTDHLTSVCTALVTAASGVVFETVIGEQALKTLHQQLFSAISATKEQKLLLSLSSALGSLHIHSSCLSLDQSLNTIMGTSKLKLLELNFATGKTLAMISSGPGSPNVVPHVFVNLTPTSEHPNCAVTKAVLQKTVREYVLGEARDSQMQAAAVWLLSLLKYSTDTATLTEYRNDIQHALSVLLSNKDHITQEVASEALALLYSSSDSDTKSQLVEMLKFSLLSETVPHKHVSNDTKIFSPEDIGNLPSSMGGGNLTTYKELCSLASDMNQPEMIYQFMHLSNNSSIWSDRVGAAFGVGHLVKSAGEELQPYLATIIPRMYRYQFDPNLKVQQSMSNIWSIIVPKPKETVDTYLQEIISDIKRNIHHKLWRTRESCSNALGELVRTRVHDDTILEEMPEFWILVLKLLDDIKESVRLSATKTAETLSKFTVKVCNVEHGKRGARAISTLLPILLDNGITSSVTEVQTVSIVTIMRVSENAGSLLAPHVHIIIPALVSASANIEPKAFGQVTTMVSGNEENKEKMELARASLALTSPLVGVIDKCVRVVNEAQLADIVPKLASHAKGLVGLTPRVTLLHSISLLAVCQGNSLTPWVGKLMGAVFGILGDRSSAVRDRAAATVAVLIRFAKPGTVDNVMEKLRSWYLEKTDDIRLLVSQVLFKMSNSASDVLRTVHDAAVPLTLFGRHSNEVGEREQWENVWLELGVSEQSATLSYIQEISSLAVSCLHGSSWTLKEQAAKTLSTVARTLADRYPTPLVKSNCEALMEVSGGRVFPGKSSVLAALAVTLTALKPPCLSDLGLEADPVIALYLKEISKKDEQYAGLVMRSLGDLILGVDQLPDCWDELWQITQSHLTPPPPDEEINEDGQDQAPKKTKKSDKFVIQQPVQESAILLLGVGWKVCKRQDALVAPVTVFLTGLMRICLWKVQLVLLCALQRLLDSVKCATTDCRSEVYTSSLTCILRCVDDAKHTSIRSLALKMVHDILLLCKADGVGLSKEILVEILSHIREQVATDNNLNLKAKGIEIVSLCEKHFVV